MSTLRNLEGFHKNVIRKAIKQIKSDKHFTDIIRFYGGSAYRAVLHHYLTLLWNEEPGIYVQLYGCPSYEKYGVYGKFEAMSLDEFVYDTIDSDIVVDWPEEIRDLITEIENNTSNLSEANKYFFGTENTNEVKKLFESVDDNYDYYNIISKLEKGSSLDSYMHPGYYENWVTGPSLSSSDNIVSTGIGFGWISSWAKTGTKGDRMKFHVYTNEPELLKKLRQNQYLETEFTAYSETPLFSSNDFSLVETLCEYFGVDASQQKDIQKYIKEYLRKLSGKNIDVKKQLSIIKTFFRNIIETENVYWYEEMIINTKPRKKLRVERDILYRLIGAYIDSSFVEDNKSWILENFGDVDNLRTFLDNDWSLRALFVKTLDELFKKYDKNVPMLWQKNIETLSIFMWSWPDYNNLRPINSVKESYPDWKKLLKVNK